LSSTLARARTPIVVYLVTTVVYLAVAGDRLTTPSPDNHFVHLAQAWLDGRLDLGGHPPGTNDWACFDEATGERCGRRPTETQKHYVSFPPFPAVLALPVVAIFGTAVWDRLLFVLLAGLAPALLFVLLRGLRERGESERTAADDLWLVALFAFGTVYFFSAVQGTVWFAAHVVASALICLYLVFAMNASRPLLAGLMLGLALATRPSTLFLGLFFVLEAARVELNGKGARAWMAALVDRATMKRIALFALPVVAVGVALAVHNYARFGDPGEYGHRFLQIRWIDRIEKWGLFSYHYLSRNLAVVLTSLPWIESDPPYVKISRHGLALWVVSPALLYLLWPRTTSPRNVALAISATVVFGIDLLYQNSGWVQFGPRFVLDWLPTGIVLLSLGGRRFGASFKSLVVISILVSGFGAISFDRLHAFYDDDRTQERYFQPH
jgi:hypothetical protein